MRAIIYARYSTDRQTESTILDQLRRCRETATARGWTVAHEFTDEGISGAAMGNRPGVQSALAALRPGDVLLVMDTTRLSRSQDLAPLLTRLRHRGVRVLGVLDGFDSDSQTARMQAGLSGIMSEEFRASIAARTHSALDMRARDARPTGGKCFGYDSTGQVIESEAELVREVFRRAADGESSRAIAADLNARGVQAPGASWSRTVRRSDGRWMVSSVHSMLGNERYIGRVVWNRSVWKRDPDTGKRTRVERPASEWVVTDGPAIVDRETWDRVRSLAAPRKFHGGRPGGGPKYLLSGVLLCGVCGRSLIVTGSKGSHYYCSTYRQGGPSACSMSIGARRDVAEEILLAPVFAELLSEEAVDTAVELMAQWARQERTQGVRPPEVDELEARIARLQAQVAAGVLEREDVAASLAVLEERRRSALAAAWRRTSRTPGVQLAAAQAAYRGAVGRFREVIQGGAIAQARAALHELVGKVVCRPEVDHLVADLALNPQPLLRAAGIAQSGSGGPLLVRAMAIRRAA